MAKKVYDILRDDNGDIVIGSNGDLQIGESTLQHQWHLLLSDKGDYKLTPLVGVGANKHLHDHRNTLARDARVEFIKDGMKVRTIKVENGKIIFDAEY